MGQLLVSKVANIKARSSFLALVAFNRGLAVLSSFARGVLSQCVDGTVALFSVSPLSRGAHRLSAHSLHFSPRLERWAGKEEP